MTTASAQGRARMTRYSFVQACWCIWLWFNWRVTLTFYDYRECPGAGTYNKVGPSQACSCGLASASLHTNRQVPRAWHLKCAMLLLAHWWPSFLRLGVWALPIALVLPWPSLLSKRSASPSHDRRW